VQFDLTADDIDDEALQVAGVSLPNGARIDRISAKAWRFVWQTNAQSAGDYRPVFIVRDEMEAEEQIEVAIHINDVNQPPEVVNAIPDVVRDEDAGQYVIADMDNVFRDPDGDNLSFRFAANDQNLQIALDNQTHVLSMNPIANYWVNAAVVTVTADDGRNQRQVAARVRIQNPAQIAFDNITRDVRGIRGADQNQPGRDATEDDEFNVRINSVNDRPSGWIPCREYR
jgi:hypothetical protein